MGMWETKTGETTRVGTSSLKMIRLVRLVRLLRLMRLHQLRELSANLSNWYFSESVLLGFRVCLWFFAIMVLNHYVACAWLGIAKYSSSETTWIRSVSFREVDEDSELQIYVLALHWSLTQFGPSTQDIVPTNLQERMFACVVVFLGLGVFSTVVSGITSAVNQLRFVNMESLVEESNMREFMTSRGVSPGLYGSVTSFFKSTYSKTDARVFEDDVKVFRALPLSVRMQMHEELYMPKLCRSAAISMLYKQHRWLLRQTCHTAMSERPVLAGHDIFLPTTEATHAYYSMSPCFVYDPNAPAVHTGLRSAATVHHRRSTTQGLTVVPVDSWLAEMALWCRWIHRGHLQASTTTHVVSLDCREFEALVIRADRGTIFGLRMFAILFVAEMERMEAMGNVLNDLPVDWHVIQAVANRAKGLTRIQATWGRSMQPIPALK